MWDWLSNLFNSGASPGGGAGGIGMMAGVPGFDPSDPGAYANRTAGGADMGGYGGSPRLPDSGGADWKGLSKFGADLMAAGAPSGSSGPSWRPMQSPVGRGNPSIAQQIPSIVQMPQFMATPPALGGLLSEWSLEDDPRRRKGGLLDLYG